MLWRKILRNNFRNLNKWRDAFTGHPTTVNNIAHIEGHMIQEMKQNPTLPENLCFTGKET